MSGVHDGVDPALAQVAGQPVDATETADANLTRRKAAAIWSGPRAN